MPRYHLTDEVQADLAWVWDFIDSRDGPVRADSVTDRIIDIFPLLAEQPYMGIARPEINLPDIRSFVVRNTPFLIFYYPRDYGVEIAYIHHSSQDTMSRFNR